MLYLRGVVCSQIVGERSRVTPTSHVGTNDSEKVFCTIARISKRKFEQKKYGQFNTKNTSHISLKKRVLHTHIAYQRKSLFDPSRANLVHTDKHP